MDLSSFDIEYVMGILKSPETLSSHPELSSNVISNLEQRLNRVNSQAYHTIVNVESVSEGLNFKDNEITLTDDWGIKLDKIKHPFIVRPENIRYSNKNFLIAEGDTLSTVGCSVVDSNLNLLGTVGTKGLTTEVGKFSAAVDFQYSARTKKFYIVSQADNKVLIYNEITKAYEMSLGSDTGVAGADGATLTSPVAISVGAKTYVLCNSGTPAGATGSGFIAVYANDGTFESIPLYSGKNGGSGKMFEGEIQSPKDMVLVPIGGRDHLYILNGNDEVGLIDTQDWSVKEIYNIPSNHNNTNLGLARIAIDSNKLYMTAKNTGKIVVVDLLTRKLLGSFGMLADESSDQAKRTLGHFNGLSGIAIAGGKIYTSESINSRVQVLGTALVEVGEFSVVFQSFHIQRGRKLIDIVYSLVGEAFKDIKLLCSTNEYDVNTAISRNLDNFKVKLLINPTSFSNSRNTFEIYPLYVLTQEFL